MNIPERVREQYELYPYPPRDPEDERGRLMRTQQETIETLCHYCYGGRNPFAEGADILIAGGGTGDATIYLAEQLRDTPSTIWYLDPSVASMEIASARAGVRGLKNIEFIGASICDLPSLGTRGQFKFINCSGVLHHLEDPEKGLRILTDCLTDDGAMAIMVYALYGRKPALQVQELARHMIPEGLSLPDKIDALRRILASLPEGHPYRQVEDAPDAGLCDAFLHAQERTYTVDQLYELLDSAELHLVSFASKWRQWYWLKTYLPDWEKYPLRTEQAIGELLAGGITQHSFLATKQEGTEADPYDVSLIPVIPPLLGNPRMFQDMPDRGPWVFQAEGVPPLSLSPSLAVRRACRLIDGEQSIEEITTTEQREFCEMMARMREWGDMPVLKARRNDTPRTD